MTHQITKQVGSTLTAAACAHTPIPHVTRLVPPLPRQIKKRVGSKASGGFLFLERPFFDVNVELTIPSVIMSPSLEDIQSAINRSCRNRRAT